MSATATNLRELHELHSRAKALRDRLASGPKTIAARTATLAARRAAVEAARKALQDAKVKAKTKEHQVQALQAKIDDHKVRLNTVKKNEEYKAIQNQIANEKNAITKLEDEQLEGMTAIETMTVELATLERDLETFAAEVRKLESEVASQSEGQKAQLAKLESAIVEAEDIIPEDERDRYRRTVKQRGADALAAVESQACTGCFVTVTAQALNDLINRHGLTWCKTCGRVLYLGEDEMGSHR